MDTFSVSGTEGRTAFEVLVVTIAFNYFRRRLGDRTTTDDSTFPSLTSAETPTRKAIPKNKPYANTGHRTRGRSWIQRTLAKTKRVIVVRRKESFILEKGRLDWWSRGFFSLRREVCVMSSSGSTAVYRLREGEKKKKKKNHRLTPSQLE